MLTKQMIATIVATAKRTVKMTVKQEVEFASNLKGLKATNDKGANKVSKLSFTFEYNSNSKKSGGMKYHNKTTTNVLNTLAQQLKSPKVEKIAFDDIVKNNVKVQLHHCSIELNNQQPKVVKVWNKDYTEGVKEKGKADVK